jgi:hypothetical protein
MSNATLTKIPTLDPISEILNENDTTQDVNEKPIIEEEIVPSNYYLKPKDLKRALSESLEADQMTNEFAKYVMLLAQNRAKDRSFAMYTYKDDMIAEGIETICRVWRRCDPTGNVYGYLSTCIVNAFKQVLNREKKSRNIRDLLLVRQGMTPSYKFQEEYKDSLDAELQDKKAEEGKDGYDLITDSIEF